MEFTFNDGGRSKYFQANKVGDCVTRAIAIATGGDYKEVYNKVKSIIGYSPRSGVSNRDIQKVVKAFGGEWHACMGIGTGCTVHMDESELPKGTIIVNLSHHLSCIKNGVINDTHDCSRHGRRCVYGYWVFEEEIKPISKVYVKWIVDKLMDLKGRMPKDKRGQYEKAVGEVHKILKENSK